MISDQKNFKLKKNMNIHKTEVKMKNKGKSEVIMKV